MMRMIYYFYYIFIGHNHPFTALAISGRATGKKGIKKSGFFLRSAFIRAFGPYRKCEMFFVIFEIPYIYKNKFCTPNHAVYWQ